MKVQGKLNVNPIHRDLLVVVVLGLISAAVFVAAGFMLAAQL
jgi:hypothetical protein